MADIDMVKLYDSGLSLRKISAIVGKSPKWVKSCIEKHTDLRPAVRKHVTHELIEWTTIEERDQLVVELYNDNQLGAYTISKKLGIGKKTVFRILQRKGVKTDSTRQSRRLTEQNIERIRELYRSGLSVSKIAKQYNCDDETVRYHINKFNEMRAAADTLSAIPVDLQEEVLKLSVNDKLSSYAIASKFGWSCTSVQNFLRRRGLTPKTGTKEWKEAVQRGIKSGGSALERRLCEILDDINIEYSVQSSLEEFRYDFGLCNDEILVEVQGSYWHTRKQRRQRDAFKQKLAKKYGKKLLIIWDYQLSNIEFVKYKILNAINRPNFDFSNLSVSNVDWSEAKQLLMQWHYQQCGRSGTCFGVKIGSDLVACAVFASPTRLEISRKQNFAHSDVLELTRLVIHPKYQANNFCSWLISRCIRNIRSSMPWIKLLISFSDPTFGHDGTIYRASNWILDGETPASYWYYHRRENKIYHKKSIWNTAKKKGLTEPDYAKTKHLLKVWGLPKLRFIYPL